MLSYHPYTIFPLGDAALTVEFSHVIDREIHKKVLSMFHQLMKGKPSFITDLIPAYGSLTICYDPVALYKPGTTAFETMAALVEKLPLEYDSVIAQARHFNLPVCYEKDYAPDIEKVAREKKLSVNEIISLHTQDSYYVYMLGFVPGFAYLGELNPALSMPRKQEPGRVSGGSVGITGRQTGIYPFDLQGGWQIIGRTPWVMFDKSKEDHTLLQPGDTVRFYSITANEFKDHQGRIA